MSVVVIKKSYKEYRCVEHNKRKYSCKLCKGNNIEKCCKLLDE